MSDVIEDRGLTCPGCDGEGHFKANALYKAVQDCPHCSRPVELISYFPLAFSEPVLSAAKVKAALQLQIKGITKESLAQDELADDYQNWTVWELVHHIAKQLHIEMEEDDG